MRRLVLAFLALAAVWLAGSSVLFLRPHDDPVPVQADAIVVLAGDAAHRLPRGIALARRGVAQTLVISREPSEWSRGRSLCDAGRVDGASVVCFRARPYSTRGEAETVARLARERDWRSLVVVTSSYHVFRARLLFRRCFTGALAVDGADYDHRWIPLVLTLETAKLLRAEITSRSC